MVAKVVMLVTVALMEWAQGALWSMLCLVGWRTREHLQGLSELGRGRSVGSYWGPVCHAPSCGSSAKGPIQHNETM